ncbi:MAG: hypothetical protein OEX00_09550 [Gammaproteobacteria bacterium]|nr:hypothetical protein [Gammaproteobacteria bacterium]MDH5692802.1 hypothetical protein [Gammaproteobacteria bacterium]
MVNREPLHEIRPLEREPSVSLEARPYGPESTADEIAALREQVIMITDDIVYWREAPITTVFQIQVFGQKLDELMAQVDHAYLLADLSHTNRPKPEVLQAIREAIGRQTVIRHMAVYTEKNALLNIAAKFALSRVGFKSVSISKTKAEALLEIARVRQDT